MATSPPLTPIRNYMSPIETSPSSSYCEQLRRRNSSFSSNHDRSPTTPRSRHRFSNGSAYSNDLQTPADEFGGGGGGGLGNLADELDQLSDEEYEEEVTEDPLEHADRQQEGEAQQQQSDGARDSGIDVSYPNKRSPTALNARNFSKPFAQTENPPDEHDEDAGEHAEEPLSRDLEELLSNIARMASSTDLPEDPLIPRAITRLQDLGNQTTLETAAQRLSKSTNSMAAHVAKETKALQTLSSSFYSPFVFSAPLDPSALADAEPLIETLLKDLPLPDPAALGGLQKLSRETDSSVQTLSALTDTLQMGKQSTNAASRHLRTTQSIVAELRRERERAESARVELQKAGWEQKIRGGWCKRECGDVVGGFEEVCRGLRERLVGAEEEVGAAG